MAEAIGVTSGLLTLVTFTLQSSKTLYQAIESFRSNDRIIRELKQELKTLNDVLKDLHDSVNNIEGGLEALRIPLKRCSQACNDFNTVIEKCTSHSSGSRTSFRDWARLRYMGEDITGFKNTIAGYKATIMIALADANM
jgi:septal ring factor EnvC (AmiA/AmiB activator)